jgi:predicted RNA-binding Zn-ribbon protein involved in translation (DUF1610 family)
MFKCPRQENRFYQPGSDIFELQCPACDESIELFKGETAHKCPKCGKMVINPQAEEAI